MFYVRLLIKHNGTMDTKVYTKKDEVFTTRFTWSVRQFFSRDLNYCRVIFS